MYMSYQSIAEKLSVLSDANRLEILDLLSCGELCACDLLAHFKFSQPTLSHHMKVLVSHEFVMSRKVGNKRMYALNTSVFTEVKAALEQVSVPDTMCACHNMKSGVCE